LSHINCKISYTSDLDFPRHGNYTTHDWCHIEPDLGESGLSWKFFLLLRLNVI